MKKDQNSLDEFFNSRLREADFPFDEKHWEEMEHRLDAFDSLQDTPAGLIIKGKHLWLGLPAVLLIFLAGWFGHAYLSDNADTQVTQQQATETIVPNKLSDRSSDQSVDHNVDQNVLEITEENPAGSRSQRTEIEAAASKSESNALSTWQNSRKRTADDPAVSRQPGTTSAGDKTISAQTANISIQDVPGESPSSGVAREVPQAEALSGTSGNSNLSKLSRLEPVFAMDEVVPEVPVIKDEDLLVSDYSGNQETENQKIPGRWGVGLTVAPDLNGVGSIGNFKMAWEVGLTGSYNIADSWRVSTGILYANKAYLSSGDDYHPPEGYWDYMTNGQVPDEVDAACDILDIPINVTYIWNPSAGFRLTTTAGTSSYFILSEKYAYSFDYYSPGQSYDWETGENSSALFSMINLGVGGEWSVSRQLIFAIDPYVKIPVRDIGYGNVRLSGMGMFFSIRKVF